MENLDYTFLVLKASFGMIGMLLAIIGFYLKKLVTTVDNLAINSATDNIKTKQNTKEIEEAKGNIKELFKANAKHSTCENYNPR